jgi:hypothetical protein
MLELWYVPLCSGDICCWSLFYVEDGYVEDCLNFPANLRRDVVVEVKMVQMLKDH